MSALRLRIDKLVDHKVEARYNGIVREKREPYVTLDEVVVDVLADRELNKALTHISGTKWEWELIIRRYITKAVGDRLRLVKNVSGYRMWESYRVPKSASSVAQTRWVPVPAMTLGSLKQASKAKLRLAQAVHLQGLYLARLAIECEARGITDEQVIASVYDEAEEAAANWLLKDGQTALAEQAG